MFLYYHAMTAKLILMRHILRVSKVGCAPSEVEKKLKILFPLEPFDEQSMDKNHEQFEGHEPDTGKPISLIVLMFLYYHDR